MKWVFQSCSHDCLPRVGYLGIAVLKLARTGLSILKNILSKRLCKVQFIFESVDNEF